MKNDGISLNVRLLAVLVLLGILLCVGVFFLHRYQVKRQSAIFLREARASVEELEKIDDPLKKVEKVDEIGNLYSRYLIQNKDDREVEKEFALLNYETAKSLLDAGAKEKDSANRRKILRYASALYASAVTRLEEVLRKDTEQPDLRAELVDILYKSGNWTAAVEHIKFLVQPPRNAAGLAKLFDRYDLWKRLSPTEESGRAKPGSLDKFLSGSDETVDREELLDFLGDDLWMILEDPKLLSIYATCKAVEEKSSIAEKALEKAVSLSPDDPELYERLAYILSAMKPPRSADADYWMNEMAFANPESFDALLRRGRYWNRVALTRESDQQDQLAKNAVHDAFAAMQKAITIIADEADRQSPSLAETKALKQALTNLPDKPPTAKEIVSPEYPTALITASAAAISLDGKLKGIAKEVEACRDGLFLAAQSKWLGNWLAGSAPSDSGENKANGDLKEAEFFAENLTTLYPDYSPGYSVLSEIYLQAGERDKAVEVLRRGSESCSDGETLLWRLASLLIDADDIEGAKTVCKKLEADDSEKYIVNHLLARIAFSEGRWQEASEGFESVRDEIAARWPSQIKRTDYLLAECYGRLGRVDRQRDAYLRAASSDRTWLPALLGIAKTKARDGQIDSAIEDYRLIMKLHDAPQDVAFDFASLLIAKNMRKPKAERDWREISEIIKSLEKAEADPLRVTLLAVDAYFAQGLDDQANNLLDETQKKLAAEDGFLQAQLVEAKNKAESLTGKAREDALAQVAKTEAAIRNNAAKQASVLNAVVKVAQRKKDWDAADKAIQAAREKAGDTVTMRLAQGENLLERYGDKAAEPLRSLASPAGFSKAARLQLWQGLAGLSLRAGDYEQANLLSRSVLKDEPGNRNMQMIRFEIAVQENDVKSMEEILGEIEKDETTPGSFWHYGQAMRLNMLAKPGDAKLFNEAQAHVAEALRMRPNWPSARLLAATLYDRQGNLEAAVESYRKAIDLGVQSSTVIRRTVQLLAGLNRFREADEVLRLLGERQDSIEGDADFESSIIKARIGEYEDAVEFARKAAAESKKATDHVWLGQLLLILGRQAENEKRAAEAQSELAEAEAAFEKAVELDPASDAAWVALIQFYGQTGKIQQAEEAVKKAKEKLPPAKAAVAIAQCYEAIGKTQEAEKQLLENLAASPRDAKAVELLADYYIRNGQNEKATDELKKIIDGGIEADPQQKTNARRSYATLLFQQGGEENRKKALEMIENNLRLNADSEADQYAKAVLLANDLSDEQRKKAIPVLEQLLDAQHSPSAEIQFTLAKLYLSENQMANFKNLMRNILRNENREPRYLAFYVDALIEHDETKEAGVYLELLKKSQPNSINTATLDAKFAFKLKNYETSIKVLKAYLDSSQGDQQTKMMEMVEAAGALASFADQLKEEGGAGNAIARGFDDEAEGVFQQFVDMQPGRELLMAQFLARQGRLPQALKMTEEHADSSTPDDIAKTCFSFLQGASPNAEQLRQIDLILQNALNKHEASQGAVVLKTAQAILRDFQQRDAETEALYREILQEKPGDPTAMNNLAIFLALHNRNLDEAAKMIDKAIIDNGRLPGLLDTRAIVYMAQNQPKKALDDLSLALKKQPTAVRYFHQAQAYFQDGQKKAAVKSLKMAQDMGLKESSLFGVERRNYQKLLRDLR